MTIRYIDTDAVSLINRELTALSGEGHAVLQRGNLGYCVDGAKDILNNDESELSICVEIAAFYIWCLGSAHIFEAGNKRTAYQAGYVFLLANGYKLTGVTREESTPLMTGITLRRVNKRDVGNWIRKYIKPISR